MREALARGRPLTAFDCVILVHVAVLIVGSSWAFGGNIGWARTALSIWGSLSVPIALWGLVRKNPQGERIRAKVLWLIPPAAFSAMVIISTFNPSFGISIIEGDHVLVHRGATHPAWPSTVSAADSLSALWFGAAAYLSAFNLSLMRNRSALRMILVLMVTNTLVLSVFGTLQKLSGTGFYFGATESPNVRFFATFIYNNHWGAFMILNLATAAGLLFYHAQKTRGRDLWHSPFSAALVGVILIAATAPMSASRAATGMATLLVFIATAHALTRIVAARRREGRSSWPAITVVVGFVAGVLGAIGWLGYKSVSERYVETRIVMEQNQSIWGSRAELYRDTWDLAVRQPAFGWGLDSYSVVLQLLRPRPIQASRQYEISYATAHNDWLQSLAETGFVGTALLLLSFTLPLLALPRRQLGHPLVVYPLIGISLVLLYAWAEFPFRSGALLFSFWILYFAAIRHAQLTDFASRNRHE